MLIPPECTNFTHSLPPPVDDAQQSEAGGMVYTAQSSTCYVLQKEMTQWAGRELDEWYVVTQGHLIYF